jgi:hypothetical protein
MHHAGAYADPGARDLVRLGWANSRLVVTPNRPMPIAGVSRIRTILVGIRTSDIGFAGGEAR